MSHCDCGCVNEKKKESLMVIAGGLRSYFPQKRLKMTLSPNPSRLLLRLSLASLVVKKLSSSPILFLMTPLLP